MWYKIRTKIKKKNNKIKYMKWNENIEMNGRTTEITDGYGCLYDISCKKKITKRLCCAKDFIMAFLR